MIKIRQLEDEKVVTEFTENEKGSGYKLLDGSRFTMCISISLLAFKDPASISQSKIVLPLSAVIASLACY